MTKDILDQFGSILMESVRDWSIEELDNIINKGGKNPNPNSPHQLFREFPTESSCVLEKMIPIAVDTTLHYFLWLIEENHDLDLVMKTPGGLQSIKNQSDGLSGELYSPTGWVARFSNQRHSTDKEEKNNKLGTRLGK